MSRLGLFFTLLVVTASAVAQSSVLAPVSRTPIIGADGRAYGVMFPTACDEQGRAYVKLLWGEPENVEPLLRISDKGVVEVQFDMSREMPLRYATRPDGGVVMFHSDEHGRFLDSFASDGKRESSMRLEPTPTPFFPSQLAVFQSGEVFIAGQQIKPSYKASAAIYNPSGALIKQLTFEEDVKREQEIVNDSGAQRMNARAVNESVATSGDDGLVYLMRPTNPILIYAISRAGEVVRTLHVTAPAGAGDPRFGLRVVNNRLMIQYRRDCGPDAKACVGSVFAIVDTDSGKSLAVYEANTKDVAGTVTCYVPDPDRFFLLSHALGREGWEIVEARAKDGSQ